MTRPLGCLAPGETTSVRLAACPPELHHVIRFRGQLHASGPDGVEEHLPEGGVAGFEALDGHLFGRSSCFPSGRGGIRGALNWPATDETSHALVCST